MMKSEKLFLNENLTLNGLAEILSISPHQLSEYINEHLNKNFNIFLNDFRVAEAENLLKTDQARSILSIGFSSGFNSSSSFYAAFKEKNEISPAKFRKQHYISTKL